MRDAEHTATRLVIAAERLLAAGGDEEVSLRAITRAARANPAAVHYHFGGRDELMTAVLERVLGPLTDRRRQLLEQASARHGDPPPVPALLDVAVRPELELLAKLRKRKVEVARFAGRAYRRPGAAVAGPHERQDRHVAAALLPALQHALPGVGPAELSVRLQLVRALVAAAFAAAPARGEPGPLGSDDVDEQVRRLVAFCAGGVAASQPIPALRAGSGRKRRKKQPRDNGRAGQDTAKTVVGML
jgi:AcrR family transcriptional regulator